MNTATGAAATGRSPTATSTTAAVRRRIIVQGVVQGVGFRPFVHRLATELQLSGFVSNNAQGVLTEVEGKPTAVEEFCRRLREEPPPLAAVAHVEYEPAAALGAEGFVIRPSQQGEGRTLIPPDTAPCTDCLRELAAPRDRRHRHPFITCTHCGPRFTITTELPYDRATTTMAPFPMCAACAAEYADPDDRRFHAQPVACPACGPQLTLVPATGAGISPTQGEQAVAEARRLLARGAVLAVKGLGGYHLACDASDPVAVAALRRRKERGGKPFAVMCADLDTAERLARIDPDERSALTSPRRPIVLLRRRVASPDLAAGVCPGSPDIGVMLPYTPLHQLLFGLPGDPPGPRVLVMTSGNRSGEPIVTDDREALTRLHGLADAWLSHDRAIEVPCDDSVVRVRPDRSVVVLRRSRGYAPAPVSLPVPVRPSLAVGGDLKNTLCLAEDRTAWLSPHIGDMADLATVRVFEADERRMRMLTGVAPELLAADRHPGYHSARWARRHAAGRPLRLVQHHHAHIASAMAGNGLTGAEPVIGVAFDGTGYGEDGAVWGGEVLLADYDRYRRWAHLAYAPLPGGDAGIGNPCRMALAQLRSAGIPWDADLPCVTACSPDERRLLARQLDRGLACVPTSSMGRLFDAVSSLAGVCHRAGYEAQAAVELEAAAAQAYGDHEPAYTFGLQQRTSGTGSAAMILDPGPVLRAIVDDLRRGIPPPVIAARFHSSVAGAVEAVCRPARRETGVRTVALTGGVFANALLDEECFRRLDAAGFTVLRHREVPPGDGGLALGQLIVAARTGSGP
ncbi:carbamoyltransferase HypF [Streptomyces sp. NPDC002896]|uniref:carbamoyltransferase HypF n=1 Tax=Streptomyces sp. NPDC002896 TaxID=3154438 RepID=UPI0033286B88